MYFFRHGLPGEERPGVLDAEGARRDLTSLVADISGEEISSGELSALGAHDIEDLPRLSPSVRLGPCLGGVGKLICVGLNYSDHATEAAMAIPNEPILFMKATSSISGPNDNVIRPKGSKLLDWEVELGVVIGKSARNLEESDAIEAVAGYCVVNDVSDRNFQLDRGGQWLKGKSADTFGPIGPYFVTRDEVKDASALRLWLEVDGNRFQDGSTSNMIFPVPFLISYISQFMTLHPGDIIATGTPAGVGMGQVPPKYLSNGSTMRLGIDGLGEQQQTVVD